MNTFPLKFKVGNLNLDVIATNLDKHQKFKVELITEEPDPIILEKSESGGWTVVKRGQRTISDQEFQELGKKIDAYYENLYSLGNILICTDFSETSINAARYAAALTHQGTNTKIILYHSYEYLPLISTTIAPVPPGSVRSKEESLGKLADLKDQLSFLVPEGTSIEALTDGRSLVSAVNILVEQHGIGLVVMGIKGKSNLEKTLVGSNTITISKECNVPLLIVPNNTEYKKIENIVFASDLKNVSKTTPVHAIKIFLHMLKAKLFILNVDRPEEEFDPANSNELTDLHHLWDSETPEYHYVNHESTAQGIMDFINQHNIQLLITVLKEYGFLEKLFHHSLTKDLAYHTDVPLLIFKEDMK